MQKSLSHSDSPGEHTTPRPGIEHHDVVVSLRACMHTRQSLQTALARSRTREPRVTAASCGEDNEWKKDKANRLLNTTPHRIFQKKLPACCLSLSGRKMHGRQRNCGKEPPILLACIMLPATCIRGRAATPRNGGYSSSV